MNTQKSDSIEKLRLLKQNLSDLIEDAQDDFNIDELKTVSLYIDSKTLEIGIMPNFQTNQQENLEFFPLIDFINEDDGIINYDLISEIAGSFVFVR